MKEPPMATLDNEHNCLLLFTHSLQSSSFILFPSLLIPISDLVQSHTLSLSFTASLPHCPSGNETDTFTGSPFHFVCNLPPEKQNINKHAENTAS